MIIAELKSNVQDLLRYFDKVVQKLNDMSVPLKQSGEIMIKSIDRNFKSEGRPDKWVALAESTIARRRKGKKKRGTMILQDTGDLKKSFVIGPVIDNSKISVGTSIVYAATHNFGRTGSTPTKGNTSTVYVIPQRKFMLFQDEDIKAIDQTFLEFMGRTLTDKMVTIG